MQTVLTALGVATNDVVAAFLGSVVGVFLLPKPSPKAVVSTVVVGTLTAIYVGPNAPLLIGMKASNMVTFFVGAGGTPLCLAILAFISQKFKSGDKK